MLVRPCHLRLLLALASLGTLSACGEDAFTSSSDGGAGGSDGGGAGGGGGFSGEGGASGSENGGGQGGRGGNDDAGAGGAGDAGAGAFSGDGSSGEGGSGGSGEGGSSEGGSSGSGEGGLAGEAGGGAGGSSGAGASGGSGGDCARDLDCADTNACNGKEVCSQGVCTKGEAEEDGEACEGESSGPHFCQEETCVASTCGDGIVDPLAGEECDDANESSADACRADCQFVCESGADCSDLNSCNGVEVCVEHACQAGNLEQKGTACVGGTAGTHFCDGSGQCLPSVCGDGIVDPDRVEQCEDVGGPNADDADGCTSTCQFSCEVAADCGNNDVCDGIERCSAVTHSCEPGTPLECDDGQACTDDVCENTRGCEPALRDYDGDGYVGPTYPTCVFNGKDVTGDCHDKNKDVHPGVLTDGCDEAAPLDNDCDGTTDENPDRAWYVDCDQDGYASPNKTPTYACTLPGVPAECGTQGTWTERKPSHDFETGNTTSDCNDLFAASPMYRPNQTEYYRKPEYRNFDYNCDGIEEKHYTNLAEPCTGPLATCSEKSGWVGSVPACGVKADQRLCAISGTVCSSGVVQWTQDCR